MRIVAFGGNRLHAPTHSLLAAVSAYTGGGDALLLKVRATSDGVLVAAEEANLPGTDLAISGQTFEAAQAHDMAAGWTPRNTAPGSFQFNDPAVPDRRLKLPQFEDLVDALPANFTLLMDVRSLAAAQMDWLIEFLEGRGRLPRSIVVTDDPDRVVALKQRRPGLQVAIAGSHLVETPADLALVPLAEMISGTGWSDAGNTLLERRHNGEWPLGLCLLATDAVPDAATLDLVAQEAAVWGVVLSSTFDVERRRASFIHCKSGFPGQAIDRRQFALGYAKSNRFAKVTCDDGVHVDIAPYDGPQPRWEGSELERRVERLEWDLINAAKEWPFYSGGGVGTIKGIGHDFAAEVTYRVERVGQATTLEMAVTNVDPGAHRGTPPTSFRDKDSFYDPHGAPPYVGVEHDEDDGYRINWNLGSEYDSNQYGRPVGDGRSPRGGRLRLERRDSHFSAYYRDAVDGAGNNIGPGDWVCVGVVSNETLNRTVHLRCVGKRWRQEKASNPSEFEPILPNRFTFRDLVIHCFPQPEGP